MSRGLRLQVLTLKTRKKPGTLDRGDIAFGGVGTKGSASVASMRNSKSFEGGAPPSKAFGLLVLRSCRNIALPVSPSPVAISDVPAGTELEHRRCDIHWKAVYGIVRCSEGKALYRN